MCNVLRGLGATFGWVNTGCLVFKHSHCHRRDKERHHVIIKVFIIFMTKILIRFSSFSQLKLVSDYCLGLRLLFQGFSVEWLLVCWWVFEFVGGCSSESQLFVASHHSMSAMVPPTPCWTLGWKSIQVPRSFECFGLKLWSMPALKNNIWSLKKLLATKCHSLSPRVFEPGSPSGVDQWVVALFKCFKCLPQRQQVLQWNSSGALPNMQQCYFMMRWKKVLEFQLVLSVNPTKVSFTKNQGSLRQDALIPPNP